ncbi:MAG: hypothetical protein J6386_10885 [Candidatus Synoicihabitans palmerolidicus]|nr:hypothetical protein [Candidatus Synoicihabitans palmerolidicus]
MEGLAQRHRDGGKAAGKGIAHALGILVRQMAKHGVTGGAFHEHANRRTVTRAEDQIAFVVAGD